MAKSSNSTSPRKPLKSSGRLSVATTAKPYPGFPLTPHPSGRWCKKIRGKLHYFGKLTEPDAALERLNREWPYLKDGRTPPPIDTGDGCTVRLLCNAFLTSKRVAVEAGELSQRSWKDYFQTCTLLVEFLGKDRRVDDLRPDDFESFRGKLAKRWGPVTLRNAVNRCRVVLKYASDQRLVDRPVFYGQSFDRPTAKALRKARHAGGRRMFDVAELTRILAGLDGKPVRIEGKDKPLELKRDPVLKAMTLLGLNCGFGNTDVATLPESALDLQRGWIDFPRPKTAIQRRVPLWPETVEALRVAIAARPGPKDPADAGLVFLTQPGRPWVRVQQKRNSEAVIPVDALSQRFGKLLLSLKINGRRGLGFYTLRHNFETIAGESKDQVAVDAIMGHVDPSMGAVYRENISDARLKAVVATVHVWLWGPKGER
jgi:integrase